MTKPVRLLLMILSSLSLTACVPAVKKEYVLMAGANPSMLKEQALAQCETQAEQIAMQQYQQELASYNQRLQSAQAMFNTDKLLPDTSTCTVTGFNRLSCKSNDYGLGAFDQLNAQVAAGNAPTYSGASSKQIERCMIGQGFKLIEIKEPIAQRSLNDQHGFSSSRQDNLIPVIQTNELPPLTLANPVPNDSSRLSVPQSGSSFGNYKGWELFKVESNRGVQSCSAVLPSANRKGAIRISVIGKGASVNSLTHEQFVLGLYDNVANFGSNEKLSVNIQIAKSQYNNVAAIGNQQIMETLLFKSRDLIGLIENNSRLTWKAGRIYDFELPMSVGLFERLHQCAQINMTAIPQYEPTDDYKVLYALRRGASNQFKPQIEDQQPVSGSANNAVSRDITKFTPDALSIAAQQYGTWMVGEYKQMGKLYDCVASYGDGRTLLSIHLPVKGRDYGASIILWQNYKRIDNVNGKWFDLKVGNIEMRPQIFREASNMVVVYLPIPDIERLITQAELGGDVSFTLDGTYRISGAARPGLLNEVRSCARR